MAAQIQTYANHRRYVPAYHFFALPVLLVNVFVETLRFSRAPGGATGWSDCCHRISRVASTS